MGLRERARKKLLQSARDLDRVRLTDRYYGLGLTQLDAVPLRMPVRVGGEVQGIKVVPRSGSPSLEVTVVDGTGRAVAVFLGRRRLPGLEFGRGMMLEGVGRKEGGRIVLLNPAYTLLSA
jgi:hypothetical protein